jgi:hypothetical protein
MLLSTIETALAGNGETDGVSGADGGAHYIWAARSQLIARPKCRLSNFLHYYKNNVNFRYIIIFYMFLYFSLILGRLYASLSLIHEPVG